MGKLRLMVVGAVLVAALVLISAAFAGNGSTAGAYDTTGAKIQKTLGSSKKQHRPQTRTVVVSPTKKPLKTVTGLKTLPFTGLDLAFVVGGGLLLAGTGLSLRRVTRKPPLA